MARLTAVVLAGGAPDAVSALEPGAPNKAFVHIGGVTLVARTIAALRASDRVGRIVAVAPAASLAHPALAGADERRADGARITDSLRSGMAGFAPGEPLLIAASDLPVLSAAAVDEVADAAGARALDVGYAILERRRHESAFPEVPHTWARLRDGTYCGGGLIVLRPRVMERLEGFLEALGAARKNPLRLAALLGLPTLVRYASGTLTVAGAERRASALLVARAGAIACTHPEVAVNVDRPGDVALAQRLVGARAGAAGSAS